MPNHKQPRPGALWVNGRMSGSRSPAFTVCAANRNAAWWRIPPSVRVAGVGTDNSKGAESRVRSPVNADSEQCRSAFRGDGDHYSNGMPITSRGPRNSGRHRRNYFLRVSQSKRRWVTSGQLAPTLGQRTGNALHFCKCWHLLPSNEKFDEGPYAPGALAQKTS